MKFLILAALTVMSLGLGVANAANSESSSAPAKRLQLARWLWRLAACSNVSDLEAGVEPVFCRNRKDEAPTPNVDASWSGPVHRPCNTQYQSA
jgi:hypothetical protein